MGELPLLAVLVILRWVVEQLVQHEQAQGLELPQAGVLQGEVWIPRYSG